MQVISDTKSGKSSKIIDDYMKTKEKKEYIPIISQSDIHVGELSAFFTNPVFLKNEWNLCSMFYSKLSNMPLETKTEKNYDFKKD